MRVLICYTNMSLLCYLSYQNTLKYFSRTFNYFSITRNLLIEWSKSSLPVCMYVHVQLITDYLFSIRLLPFPRTPFTLQVVLPAVIGHVTQWPTVQFLGKFERFKMFYKTLFIIHRQSLSLFCYITTSLNVFLHQFH